MLGFVRSAILAPLRPQTMSQSAPQALDSLRSTRTRIAKPRPAARPSSSAADASATMPEAEIARRDFSRFLGDVHPLRVIFVGHNPSEVSWERAAPYAHRTNRFWRLLKEAELAPEHLCEPEFFSELPKAAGIGFIDLFVTCGSDASLVGRGAEREVEWRREFLARLVAGTHGKPPQILCCVSKIVAKKLLKGWDGGFGCIGKGSDWGLDGADTSDIWVLPSTSGRAGLTWEQRLQPFEQLKAQFLGEWEA